VPPPRRRLAALAALAALSVALTACGEDDASSGGAQIVVTTPVLGAVVEDLVADAAEVRVLIPNGVDPHDYQPSAQDVGALEEADLVVENGLDLEEGLEDPLGEVRGEEGRVFTATDHIDVRVAGEDPHAGEEEHAGDEEHGPEDPHFWMDPASMAAVVTALGPVLRNRLGLDLGDRAQAAAAGLEALDAQVEEALAPIPARSRRLVTGHESMGYFARRYDFELVGALIPSLSSQAQASAANLAALRAQVEREGVPAIFTEAGTPAGVAEAISRETGARVLEIGTHALPEDGSYATFMRRAAATVRDGLTGS
jgi:zinc/manganese transport system substrate-binding protein